MPGHANPGGIVKKRRLAFLTAVGVAALAVLTACSSPDGASDDVPSSPLSEYLEAIWGSDLSPKEQQREFEERQKKTEELVAQCMADEGFEYTPNIQDSSWVGSDDLIWEPDDREWVAQYGYGYVNSPQPPTPEEEQVYEDPNQDYVDGLSMSEQNAYYVALYGETNGEEEYDWKTAGCMGAAQQEVSPDPTSDERFADLNDALDDF
jgi:hypothetical protein